MADWWCKDFIWVDTIKAVILAMIDEVECIVSDPRVNEHLKHFHCEQTSLWM